MADAQTDGAPVGAVSIVFTDIEGSTDLWERQEAAMATALRLHDALVREHIEDHAGYEVKAEGDAFMVVFDSSLRAVQFCMAVQEALVAVDWPEELASESASATERGFRGLRVRMGVHTGAPLARLNPMTGRTDYFGPVVNRAARVAAAASGGQILVSAPVWLRVKDDLTSAATEHFTGQRLKGIPEQVDLVQVLPVALSERSLPSPRSEADDHTANIRVFGFLHRVGGTRYAFPITRRACTLGRSSACDLVLAEDGVSKVHCAIRIDIDGSFTLTDEGSTNGTFVNGEQVRMCELGHDDRVRIGDVEFRVQIGNRKTEQARAADEQFTMATRVLDASEIHPARHRAKLVVAGLSVLVLLVLTLGAAAVFLLVN